MSAKQNATTNIFGNSLIAYPRPFSAIFRYSDGQICWPATDYFADLQRGPYENSTLETYVAPLEDIVAFMSSLEMSDPCYQFAGASDEMFLKLRSFLQGHQKKYTNISINKRLTTLIALLLYIQEEYDAETHLGEALISVKGDSVVNAGVTVEKLKSKYDKTYYKHHSFLPNEKYSQRSPITTKAMDEATHLIELHSKVNSRQALYNSEVLRLSTDLFESTGIRAGELVYLKTQSLELLREQLAGRNKTLKQLLDAPSSMLSKYFTKSESVELLNVLLTFMTEDSEIIWLLVVTNKSTVNAGKPRIVPIGRPLAQNICDFYQDFIVDMCDLTASARRKIDRAESGYLITKFDGKPFFNEQDIDDTEDMVGHGKLFSAFYSNKIGQKAKEKISPHLFRHRFITNIVVKMLEAADDRDKGTLEVILKRVSRLSGHASIDSLWTYIDRSKISLNNKALVRRKLKQSKLDALCKKHGICTDSDFVKELKLLMT